MDHRLNEGIIYLCQQKEQKPINNAAAPSREKLQAAAASLRTEPYCQRPSVSLPCRKRNKKSIKACHDLFIFIHDRYRQELAA
jgi:hypothetical protein